MSKRGQAEVLARGPSIFVSAPLCGSPSGITQLIFTFLLTSDLAHPLNRPNGIPQIPPCPVLVRSPSLPLPASLSLFFALRGLGRKIQSLLEQEEKAEGNRNKERQQRYFAGGSAARTVFPLQEAHVRTQVQELRSQKLQQVAKEIKRES